MDMQASERSVFNMTKAKQPAPVACEVIQTEIRGLQRAALWSFGTAIVMSLVGIRIGVKLGRQYSELDRAKGLEGAK